MDPLSFGILLTVVTAGYMGLITLAFALITAATRSVKR